MRILFLMPVIFLVAKVSIAQTSTYDFIRFTPPKGWTQEEKKNILIFSTINNNKRTWCQLQLVTAKAGSGDADTDLKSEWAELVVKPYRSASFIIMNEQGQLDGWSVRRAKGRFIFDGKNIDIQLITYSNATRCASIVTLLSSNDYAAQVNGFLKTVRLLNSSSSMPVPAATTLTSSYKFTITNFDDGWTSVEKPNWVEVSKGDSKVLIHYPNQSADAYNSVLKAVDMNAWNLLVVPHYTNMRNLEYGSIQSFQSVTFLSALGTEPGSGKNVYVVLFKLHDNKGTGRYMEFITRDKATYNSQFVPYHDREFGWDKLIAMQYRNKFAVGAGDLVGKWTSSDFASLNYYYVSTGGYACATATSIADEFEFLNDSSYRSEHSGASGQVGAMKFSQQKNAGAFRADNWKLQLTNRFGNQTQNFDCRFEAVKGGRVLILNEAKEGDGFKSSYTLVKK